jgi:hypothetical protein
MEDSHLVIESLSFEPYQFQGNFECQLITLSPVVKQTDNNPDNSYLKP